MYISSTVNDEPAKAKSSEITKSKSSEKKSEEPSAGNIYTFLACKTMVKFNELKCVYRILI